jgi:hypothetical protein
MFLIWMTDACWAIGAMVSRPRPPLTWLYRATSLDLFQQHTGASPNQYRCIMADLGRLELPLNA